MTVCSLALLYLTTINLVLELVAFLSIGDLHLWLVGSTLLVYL
jgi:hypothetical protein